MKITPKTPQESLDKALLRFRPTESKFEQFKTGLSELTSKIDEAKREDNQEIHVQNFLRDVFYKGISEVNKKGDIDLAIHLSSDAKSSVGVLIEAKRPGNKAEMLSAENPNTKAIHELVLYFMRERVDEENNDIRYLIATNINEWFIFSAQDFNHHFYVNKKFRTEYEAWRDDLKVSSNTPKLNLPKHIRPFTRIFSRFEKSYLIARIRVSTIGNFGRVFIGRNLINQRSFIPTSPNAIFLRGMKTGF